jgi:hypothetical protein
MIRGMRIPMRPRNSATMLINDTITDQRDYMPRSENFNKVSAPASRTLLLMSLSK